MGRRSKVLAAAWCVAVAGVACGSTQGSSTSLSSASPTVRLPSTHAVISVGPGWHQLDALQHGAVPGQIAVGTGSGYCPARRTVELTVTPHLRGEPSSAPPPSPVSGTSTATEQVQVGDQSVTASIVTPPSVDCPSSSETMSVTDSGTVWFIDVSGDPTAAAEHHGDVLAMLRSLRFEPGSPSPVPLP